jgi:hypothetical protein
LKGLQRAVEVQFCSYDDTNEVVWVHEMAKYQIGDSLKITDLQCKGVQNEYNHAPQNRFLSSFFDRYAAAFHMTFRREFRSPFEAPSKPLQSQAQAQAQAQAEDLRQQGELVDAHPDPNGTEPTPKPNGLPPCPHKAILAAWAEIMPDKRQPRPGAWKPSRTAYKALAARWREGFTLQRYDNGAPLYTDTETGIAWWRGFLANCRTGWLMECTQFDLDWIVKPENFTKANEGKYRDKRKP